jgi:hypothetical protein
MPPDLVRVGKLISLLVNYLFPGSKKVVYPTISAGVSNPDGDESEHFG